MSAATRVNDFVERLLRQDDGHTRVTAVFVANGLGWEAASAAAFRVANQPRQLQEHQREQQHGQPHGGHAVSFGHKVAFTRDVLAQVARVAHAEGTPHQGAGYGVVAAAGKDTARRMGDAAVRYLHAHEDTPLHDLVSLVDAVVRAGSWPQHAHLCAAWGHVRGKLDAVVSPDVSAAMQTALLSKGMLTALASNGGHSAAHVGAPHERAPHVSVSAAAAYQVVTALQGAARHPRRPFVRPVPLRARAPVCVGMPWSHLLLTAS